MNHNNYLQPPRQPFRNDDRFFMKFGIPVLKPISKCELIIFQADKVRQLKSSGVEKSIWQPEVTILLDLKKKLETAKKNVSHTPVPTSQKSESVDPADLKRLEEEIAKQADKVRQLKSSGVEKSIWQPEVTILLDLKKKLETAKKNMSHNPVPTSQKSESVDPADLKRLEEEIAKQGMVVRKLKEGGADKSRWQPEVNKLLALKNQLAAISGVPASTSQQKNKKLKK